MEKDKLYCMIYAIIAMGLILSLISAVAIAHVIIKYA